MERPGPKRKGCIGVFCLRDKAIEPVFAMHGIPADL